MNLTWAYLTDVGLQRGTNEDAALAMATNLETFDRKETVALFAVSDGMGGKAHGEVAAKITLQTLGEHVLRRVMMPVCQPHPEPVEGPVAPAADAEPALENPAAFLREAIRDANRRIHSMRSSSEQVSMGATVSAVLIHNDVLAVGHVGDCRCYFLDHSSFRLLTRDHSMVQELLSQGILTEEEARNHPRKNILSRSLGSKEDVEVDTYVSMIPRGVRIMLCTDGLHGAVDEEMVREILCRHVHPKEQAGSLVRAANQAGGKDNITALVTHFH